MTNLLARIDGDDSVMNAMVLRALRKQEMASRFPEKSRNAELVCYLCDIVAIVLIVHRRNSAEYSMDSTTRENKTNINPVKE